MGSFQIKIPVKKLGFALASLLAPLVFAGQSYAALPYFKVYNGDVSTGGGFNNGTDSSPCLAAASFQAPTYTSPIGNPNKGGIMAFVNVSFTAGASAQLGAFSLGVISNGTSSTGDKYGFFAGGNPGNKLTFANDADASITNYYGGVFENARLDTSSGGHKLTHCISDYYGIKGTGATTISAPGNLNLLATGKYLVSSGDLTVGASTIDLSKNVTVFVNGNVFINGSIAYASNYTDANVPKLAIVAQGNIYINPSATTLTGLYIAQPKTGVADSGKIWTCHDSSTSDPTSAWLLANCNNNLTVNGAFIGKQIQLTRVKGDVGSVATLPNESPNPATTAEIFNYTPEMIVGGGFFNQGSSFGKIQSLVNLPPVF